MAVPSFTRTADLPGRTVMHTWTLTTADHTGEAMETPGTSDRTVTATGTWGGATFIMEGSNDNAVFLPLTDNGNTAISMTTNGIEVILQNPRYIRPRLSAVGAGATVVVQVFSRSTMQR